MIRVTLADATSTNFLLRRAVTDAAMSLAARTTREPGHWPFDLVMSPDTLTRIVESKEINAPGSQGRFADSRFVTRLLGLPVRIDPTMPDNVILVNDPRTMLNEQIGVL